MLKTGYFFGRLLFYCVLFVCMQFSSGCAASQQKNVRASTQPSDDWQMYEDCGYEGCEPMVDFLKGPDITFKAEFDEGRNSSFFIIRLNIISLHEKSLQFYPPNVYVILPSGDKLTPKVFTCSNTIWDLSYLRTQPSLLAARSLSQNDCILLFFDHPFRTVESGLVLNVEDAIVSYGKSIGVPLIKFKKKTI